jgi:transposase, IS5 family
MREFVAQQRPLVAGPIDHAHAAELEGISQLLDQLKGAPRRITQDLQRDVVHTNRGRRGLSGEQVLRILVLKLLTGFSYARLEFHLADSSSYRRFCRLSIAGETPRASTLQANIKRIRPETVEWVHRRLLRHARALGVEDGECALVDSTGSEVDIHHPNDSFLLSRGVAILTRLLQRSRQFVDVPFSDHSRRANRRAKEISNAKSMKAREPVYRELVKVTTKSLGYARRAVEALAGCGDAAAVKLGAQLASAVGGVARWWTRPNGVFF